MVSDADARQIKQFGKYRRDLTAHKPTYTVSKILERRHAIERTALTSQILAERLDSVMHFTRPMFLLIAIAFIRAPSLHAAEYRLAPHNDATALGKRLEPGDTVTLTNGEWRDVSLRFDRVFGAAEKPIHIRAASPGQVVFTGKSEFRIGGEYLTVSGLVFRDIERVSDVFELRSHSERLAKHCRVTDCLFEQTDDNVWAGESRWLSIYGTGNRVDHCTLRGKKGRGPTAVVWVAEGGGGHRIDHNFFGHRPELGRNGGETLRVGDSRNAHLSPRVVVEDNYFERCNGEAELVSNKSCENVYRHNVFNRCSGTLSLRHGHRCLVDSNLFLGHRERGTGGVRIIGEDHVVTNNYFESLRGDEERAALSISNGIPNGPANGYSPVKNALVAHNTLIDCKVSLEVGVGAGKKQSVAPADCRIAFNLFAPGKWGLMRSHAALTNFSWHENRRVASDRDDKSSPTMPRVAVEFVRDEPSSRLVPSSFQQLTVESATSETDHDVGGRSRVGSAVVGCDVPGKAAYHWPTPNSAGIRF